MLFESILDGTNAEFRGQISEVGIWKWEFGSGNLEVGIWKWEVGVRKWEVGILRSWILDIGL